MFVKQLVRPLTVKQLVSQLAGSGVASEPLVPLVPGTIIPYAYYKNSAFSAISVAEALDTSRTVLRAIGSSQLTTGVNMTNYNKGVNGLVFDIAGAGNVTVGDFTFRMGKDSTPGAWPAGPTPSLVHVTPGDEYTYTRVRIEWADNAIFDTWIQVTIAANANTGLGTAAVFYLGNVAGKQNISGTLRITNTDVAAVNTAISTYNGNPSPVTELADVNKDGFVNTTDSNYVSSRVAATIRNVFITVPAI